MTLIIIITIIIIVLGALVLEHNIKNRFVLGAFCLSLIIGGSVIGFAYLSSTSNYTEPDESTIRHITAQQQAFGEWYTIYKKRLDNIDYYWGIYHRVMKDFKEEKISLSEAYRQLTSLEADISTLQNNIFQMTPPISLDDDNYDLTTSLLQKTKAYSAAQLKTIQATRMASEPEKNLTDSHEQQVQKLNNAMLKNSPDMLFIANEITSLRSNLTIPEVD